MTRYMLDLFFEKPFLHSIRRYIYADKLFVARCLNDECTSAVMLIYDSDDIFANYINETYFVYMRCPRCGYRVKLGIPAEFLEEVIRKQAKALAEGIKAQSYEFRKRICLAWKDVCEGG